MLRSPLLLSAVVFAICFADIPVLPTRNGFDIRCYNQVSPQDLGLTDRTVAGVLKATGLSLFDFALLQRGQLGIITPQTVLEPARRLCIAGYYSN